MLCLPHGCSQWDCMFQNCGRDCWKYLDKFSSPIFRVSRKSLVVKSSSAVLIVLLVVWIWWIDYINITLIKHGIQCTRYILYILATFGFFFSCSILVILSIFLVLAWHMVRIYASLGWFVMFYIPRRKSSCASYDTNRNAMYSCIFYITC